MLDIDQCGRVREPSAKLSEDKMRNIECYILGAVYGYCAGASEKRFSVRALFGESNRDWNETPLIDVFEYYIQQEMSEDVAIERAGRDVGCLLKRILFEDKKYHYQKIEGYVNEYVRV